MFIKFILGTTNEEKSSDLLLALNTYCPDLVYKNSSNVINLRSIKDEYFVSTAKENGKTVEENAMIKLHHYKKILEKIEDLRGSILICEDTGLFIRELDWNPGVHTARFVGDHDFSKMAEKVISLMNGAIDRFAFVKSAVAMTRLNCGEDTTVLQSEVMYGEISEEVYKGEGFDFDKMFIKSGENVTFAESCSINPLERLEIPRSLCIQKLMNNVDKLI